MNIKLPLEKISSNEFQPCINFSSDTIEELVFNINSGKSYTLIVKRNKDMYEVVVGEKILQALKKSNVTHANVIVTDLKDDNIFKLVNFSDLTTIEEAVFYLNVMKESGCTQEELADTLSKSQSTIANKIRILNLPQEIQDALTQKVISERHARSLLPLEGKLQFKAYNEIVSKGLNVRKSEEYVNSLINKKIQSKKYLTKGFTRNAQIALNSVNQCLDMIKQLGVEVKQDVDENDEEVVITLTISK